MRISEETITRVRRTIKNNSLRKTAEMIGVSFTTVQKISRGVYDTGKHVLPEKKIKGFDFNGRCVITGFILWER